MTKLTSKAPLPTTAELKYQLGPTATATALDMQLGWPSHVACLHQNNLLEVEEKPFMQFKVYWTQ